MVAIIISKAYENWNERDIPLVAVIRPTAPIRPIKTPKTFTQCDFCLKNVRPIIKVNNGVREFNTPASELPMTVCAFANKNEGMPVPRIPIIAMYFHFFKGTLFILERATGSKTKKETTILRAPTISLEKTSNPRFIKMKEVPQISMRIMRMPQAIVFRFKMTS
jgi:hypothetical protein